MVNIIHNNNNNNNNKKKKKNNKIYIVFSSAAGFEPTRAKPTRFQVWRLNHSAILTHFSCIYIYIYKYI